MRALGSCALASKGRTVNGGTCESLKTSRAQVRFYYCCHVFSEIETPSYSRFFATRSLSSNSEKRCKAENFYWPRLKLYQHRETRQGRWGSKSCSLGQEVLKCPSVSLGCIDIGSRPVASAISSNHLLSWGRARCSIRSVLRWHLLRVSCGSTMGDFLFEE